MYVCTMYVCMYACMHACMYVYVCVCIWAEVEGRACGKKVKLKGSYNML